MCRSVAFMVAELLGREQLADKETVAHTKTIEELNSVRAVLEETRAKLAELEAGAKS